MRSSRISTGPPPERSPTRCRSHVPGSQGRIRYRPGPSTWMEPADEDRPDLLIGTSERPAGAGPSLSTNRSQGGKPAVPSLPACGKLNPERSTRVHHRERTFDV